MAATAQDLQLGTLSDRLAQRRQEREQARERGDGGRAQASDQQAGQARQELFKAAEQAHPAHIAQLQGRLREQRESIERSMGANQERGQEMGNKQGQEHSRSVELARDWSPGALERRREDRQQGQGRGQGWERQQGDTPRLNPAYGAAAETTADRAADRQLEQDQRTMHQALGRPATDAEMKAFEARRAQDQAKTQQGPSKEGQDLLARREERRRSMGMSQ